VAPPGCAATEHRCACHQRRPSRHSLPQWHLLGCASRAAHPHRLRRPRAGHRGRRVEGHGSRQSSVPSSHCWGPGLDAGARRHYIAALTRRRGETGEGARQAEQRRARERADSCERGSPRRLGRATTGSAQRLFEHLAEPPGGRKVAWQPSGSRGQSSRAASPGAGCTDRSAGGCADRCPLSTARARATVACHRAPPGGCQSSAGAGSPVPLPERAAATSTPETLVQAVVCCPQALGTTARPWRRTDAARGAWVCCRSGAPLEEGGV
jgi:hypothetical protein